MAQSGLAKARYQGFLKGSRLLGTSEQSRHTPWSGNSNRSLPADAKAVNSQMSENQFYTVRV